MRLPYRFAAKILGLLPAFILISYQLILPPEPANVATFSVTDYAFVGPEQVPAGFTRIRIENESQGAVRLQLVQLLGDQTVENFVVGLQTKPGKPPAWIPVWFGHYVAFPGMPLVVPPGHRVGTVKQVEPGQAGYITLQLIPGHYAFLCLTTGPDAGASHGMLDMLRGFRVG